MRRPAFLLCAGRFAPSRWRGTFLRSSFLSPSVSDALSAPQGARSSTAGGVPRNVGQELSTRLLKVPLAAIADAIDKDETAACRIRANERPCTLSEFGKLIDLAGLKVVDKTRVCVDRKAYESLTYIAQKALANEQTAHTLIWEDD